MSIPASEIVSVTPSVLSAGGNPLALNGLVLTDSSTLPIGAPMSFVSAAAVSTYFGSTSTEADVAAIYFEGFEGSTQKPASILFSRFATASGAAFGRGAANNLSLAQIKAITAGSLYMTVDGSPATVTSVNLSTATSFSDAASKISTAFTGGSAPVVTYDSNFGAFVLTSQTTGGSSTVAYPTGTLATSLNLLNASGAILSQGADPTTAADHLNAIIAVNQNWATFMTTWEPVITTGSPDVGVNKQSFATWANGESGRYVYVAWDTAATAIGDHSAVTDLNNFGEWLKVNDIQSVCPVYNTVGLAAFVLGTTASIDFASTNARITYAFKQSTGMAATVTDSTQAANLIANGYNFYGSYATANDSFIWFYPGMVSGAYSFLDTQINSIWLSNQIQLAEMNLFANSSSVPYNSQGYGLIKSAASGPINDAVNFGAIRGGVNLSASQIAQVNTAAGVQIDITLATRGWYFQVLPASAQVRAVRQSPPCKLWYMDGGAVHQLNIASIAIK